jgi:hypothetical protein
MEHEQGHERTSQTPAATATPAGAPEHADPTGDRTDPIELAREYGLDIGLMNALLDLPVIERLRRNDEAVALDRVLRRGTRSAAL